MAKFGGTYTGTRGTGNGSANIGFVNTLTAQLGANHTLDSVEVDIEDNGTNDDYRVGVYYGDSASLTLVWDSGQLDSAGLDGIQTLVAGGETLPAGEDIHVVIVSQAVTKYRHLSDASENGDWAASLRTLDGVSNVTSALPASTASTANAILPLRMWINATSTATGVGSLIGGKLTRGGILIRGVL